LTDLLAVLERVAAFTPSTIAVRFEGGRLTYAELVARCRAVAEALAAREIGYGDRVALLADNHPDTLALLFACSRLGAAMLPLNWRLADEELDWILSDAAPALLAVGPGHEARSLRLAASDPTVRLGAPLTEAEDGAPPRTGGRWDDVLLVYTSGTTGRPKGARVPQSAILSNAVQSHHMHQMSAADHVLTVLPMFHVGGLNIQTTPALLAGATVTLHSRFEPAAALEAMESERPTLTVLVPTTMEALMALPRFAQADLSSLRAVATGSTIVPEPLIEAMEARGVPVLCVYGSTETCPIAAYDRAGLPRVKRGTGRAGILAAVAVVDERGRPVPSGEHGEIAVRGDMFTGYLGDEAATQETIRDGWIMTGDIGSLAADGTLTVHDRKRNMIVSGGENVYPAEVERVLCGHPAVAECAVVGRPDPRWQEVPVAFVRLGAPVAPEELVAHVRAHLAGFKVPRDVRVVDALPRTALGKVRHDVLRAMASEAAGHGAA